MTHNQKLAGLIAEVAEIAGYLWQKGWAERNGGNISVNITDVVDASITDLPALMAPIAIGCELPHLRGCYFLVTGTNKRMRNVAETPMSNASIIRICADCASYEIVAEQPVRPTSELPAHLSVHNYLIGRGSSYKAVMHTHPIELVAMSHHAPFLQKDVLGRLLWSMIPETRAFCPRGLGIVPYQLPGSLALAQATIDQLADHDVVMWEKHGVVSVHENVTEAFDMVDTLTKSAQIYLSARAMGFIPAGMSESQMQELKEAFNL